MRANEERCKELGLDPTKVESIARRISKAATEAREMGIAVFGWSGTGSLMVMGRDCGEEAIVADLDGHFDGGDP